MTDKPGSASATDPHHIPETLCIGRFNVVLGPLSTITFTHSRPRAEPLIDSGVVEYESIVRARIVTSYDNMVALRDLLNQIIKDPGPASEPH